MRPLKAIPIPTDTFCRYLELSRSGDLLILGFDNGEYQLRNIEKPEKWVSIKMHDGHRGRITSVKFDYSEKFLLSTGTDGLLYVYQIDKDMIKKESAFDPLDEIENPEYIPNDELE